MGDPGSVPGWGRSPGTGNGNPLQYSCLENPMDRGAWWAAVHGVEKSWRQLFSLFSFHLKAESERVTLLSLLASYSPFLSQLWLPHLFCCCCFSCSFYELTSFLTLLLKTQPRAMWSVLNGKETPNRGDICVCIADSPCCAPETNTAL